MELVKKEYIYEPGGPYKIVKGLGPRKKYKRRSLEILFFSDPEFLYTMLDFARRKLKVGQIFRDHLEWLFAAGKKMPLPYPPCGEIGCVKKGTIISIRHSQDHQVALSMSHVYCEDHFREARIKYPFCSQLPWQISSMRLLPKDKNLIADYVAKVWKVKRLTPKKIFWRFKEVLPKMVTTIDSPEYQDKDKVDKGRYHNQLLQLTLF